MLFGVSCGLLIGVILCGVHDASKLDKSDLESPEVDSQRQKRQLFQIWSFGDDSEKNYSLVTLNLINRTNPADYEMITLKSIPSMIFNSLFDVRLNTVIYCFGLTENQLSPTTQAVIKAYAARGDHNIIVVDWSLYNGKQPSDYPESITNMKAIGGIVGKRIFRAFTIIGISRFHLVGHSLGAHLAAYINRAALIPQLKIPKIIGLDPAGPYMYDPSMNHQPLNATDADIVQVIHTDIGAFGGPANIGSVNFYPNGGGSFATVMPGCPPKDLANNFTLTNFCSHSLSVFYYSESVATNGSDVFKSVQCNSFDDFKAGNCTSTFSQMGFPASGSSIGNFYLQTNSAPPFSRGADGTKYSII